jgi:hypothetical protein
VRPITSRSVHRRREGSYTDRCSRSAVPV